jgi:hypothetical protein
MVTEIDQTVSVDVETPSSGTAIGNYLLNEFTLSNITNEINDTTLIRHVFVDFTVENDLAIKTTSSRSKVSVYPAIGLTDGDNHFTLTDPKPGNRLKQWKLPTDGTEQTIFGDLNTDTSYNAQVGEYSQKEFTIVAGFNLDRKKGANYEYGSNSGTAFSIDMRVIGRQPP